MIEALIGTPEYDDVNNRHAANPEPGDYWHEMFCPIRVVLAVDGHAITICEKKRSVDESHWTWDLSVTRTLLKADFGNGLRHSSEAMRNKYHCDVAPRAHIAFVKEFADMQKVLVP